MRNLIRKILKESFEDDFSWTEDLFNKPITIDTYEFKIGEDIMFVPTEEEGYSKCIGKVSKIKKVPYSEDEGWSIQEINQVTLSSIVCDPQNYKFPNDTVEFNEVSDWGLDHDFYKI